MLLYLRLIDNVSVFCMQVVTLEEFFGEEDVFFVYGSERLNPPDDFDLEIEGNFIQLINIKSLNMF